MTEFKPPISTRDTTELIYIAHSSTDEYQELAIEQAKEELKKRKIPKEYENELISGWREYQKQEEIAYQQQLEIFENESYSKLSMILIFIFAPIIFFKPIMPIFMHIGETSLIELYNNNYKRKFKQKLILLISGFIFWPLMLFLFDSL